MSRNWPFRRYLWLLIASVAIPLCGLLAYKFHELAAAQRRDAERITINLAQNQAIRVKALLDNTQRMAALVAERPRVRALDRGTCDPLLADLLRLLPLVHNVSVLGLDRRFICSARPPASDAPVRWHSGFAQALRGLPGLSGPVLGALDQRWIIAVSHPVRDGSERVAGLVTLTLDLNRLGAAVAAEAVWPGTIATIVDEDKLIVTRTVAAGSWIGKSLHELPALERAAGQSGTIVTADNSDGIERIYAVARINNEGWRVFTGIPTATLLAQARTETSRDLSVMALIILLFAISAAILARRLASPVRKMDVALRKIAAGRQDIRVPEGGPRELAELARRFNIALDTAQRAEQNRAQLAAIVESSTDAIISRSMDRKIISWNRTAEQLFGWTAEEAIGQPVDIITPPQFIGMLAPQIERINRGETVAPVETWRQRKDGSRFQAQVALSGVRDSEGRIVAIATIIRDITERKRAEEELRSLSRRLNEVEENERRNIHRELHDQIGANLSALKLDLSLIAAMLPEQARSSAGVRLQKTQQLAGETIARIRDVMADLRPPALDDYGLLAALRSHAGTHSERLGIPIAVSGEDIVPRLPITTETALFRIAQEALNNIAKHAQAGHVEITVRATAAQLSLSICDDGRGFDAADSRVQHESWGLRTMHERARAIAAAFSLDSRPGAGTRITVEVARTGA